VWVVGKQFEIAFGAIPFPKIRQENFSNLTSTSYCEKQTGGSINKLWRALRRELCTLGFSSSHFGRVLTLDILLT